MRFSMAKYVCVETGRNTDLVHLVSQLRVVDETLRIDLGPQLYVGTRMYDLIRVRAIDYDTLLHWEEHTSEGDMPLQGGYVISRHCVGQFSHLSLDNVLFFSTRTMQEVLPWTKAILERECLKEGSGVSVLQAMQYRDPQ